MRDELTAPAGDPEAGRGRGVTAICAAWAALVWLTSAASAQEVGGSLEGRVLGPDGAPLQAQIVVTGATVQGRRATVTDDRGRFRLDLLPVGRCRLAISALGHGTVVLDGVVVSLGVVADVGEVRLAVEAIEVPGTTVVSAREATARRSTAIGGSLTRSELRSLPTDRDYLSAVALLPHAEVSYYGDRLNLAGTTGPESDFHVDGMRLNEPPGNAVSTSLPYNMVEEIRVLAGGYEAEHGGAGGGVVNAVTAPGGNDFHGQAFGFAADRALTAASGGPAVSPKTRDYGSWDAGISADVPLRRDRLWLFLAWNPTFEVEDVELPGFGIEKDRRRAQRFATKLSWRPNEATSIALSGVGDPSTRDQVGGIVLSRTNSLGNIDPMLSRRRGGGWGGSLRVLHLFGARASLDLRAGITRSEYSEQPATARGGSEPVYVDETGYVEGGLGQIVDREAGRSTLSAVLGTSWRSHSIKAGIAYEDAFFDEHLTYDQLFRLAPGFYRYVTLDDRHSANHTRVPAAFVQDSWPIADRLLLNAGLRWTSEYWMTSGGDLGQRIGSVWQPRLGLVWRPEAAAESRVFASWGRFHQQTRLNVPGFFLQDVPSVLLVRDYFHDPRLDPSGADTLFMQVLGRQPEVPGLRPALFDELQLGAEGALRAVRVGMRGVYRSQRSGVVGVASPVSGQGVYGNPGLRDLAPYPEVERVYRALEVSAGWSGGDGNVVRASYVWSRSRGNYEGYWDQSAGQNDPIGGGAFMPDPGMASNTTGPLPGDRAHRFKCHAARALGGGVHAGATFVWASGTPLNELGGAGYLPPFYYLLAPRGSVGRTPSIYDLNLRLAWEPPFAVAPLRTRVLADAYHVGNPRKPVFLDQVHYFGTGTTGLNPNYLKPVMMQPPVAYRFGVEIDW